MNYYIILTVILSGNIFDEKMTIDNETIMSNRWGVNFYDFIISFTLLMLYHNWTLLLYFWLGGLVFYHLLAYLAMSFEEQSNIGSTSTSKAWA